MKMFLVFLLRIFTGSTRLDGNAIGEHFSFFCIFTKKKERKCIHGVASCLCSGLCAMVVCGFHGWAGIGTSAQNVQPAEDRRDFLLQHEPHQAAVVSDMAGHWWPLQQGKLTWCVLMFLGLWKMVNSERHFSSLLLRAPMLVLKRPQREVVLITCDWLKKKKKQLFRGLLFNRSLSKVSVQQSVFGKHLNLLCDFCIPSGGL